MATFGTIYELENGLRDRINKLYNFVVNISNTVNENNYKFCYYCGIDVHCDNLNTHYNSKSHARHMIYFSNELEELFLYNDFNTQCIINEINIINESLIKYKKLKSQLTKTSLLLYYSKASSITGELRLLRTIKQIYHDQLEDYKKYNKEWRTRQILKKYLKK